MHYGLDSGPHARRHTQEDRRHHAGGRSCRARARDRVTRSRWAVGSRLWPQTIAKPSSLVRAATTTPASVHFGPLRSRPDFCGSPPSKAVTRSIVAPHLAAANGFGRANSPTPGQTTVKKGLWRVAEISDCPAELVFFEPMTGIEPAYSAWEADVLPLNYIGTVDIEG